MEGSGQIVLDMELESVCKEDHLYNQVPTMRLN